MKSINRPSLYDSLIKAYQFSAPFPTLSIPTYQQSEENTTGEVTGQRVTSVDNDPDFIHALPYVLNPDPTLARLGYAQTVPVYERLAEDAHVAGIIQRMYAGLVRFETHVQPGGLRKVDKLAAALCEKILDTPPSPNFSWDDFYFKVYECVLYGFDLKEIVWDYKGKYLLPTELIDVPRRRVLFTPYGLPLVRTRGNFLGEPLHPNNYLLTRHRATVDNPYGFAALSSCYWLVNFKRMVMEYYVKFIERHGSPWAIGKYPPGTKAEAIDTILNQLSNMLDSACAAVPDNVAVEFMEAQTSEKMIHSGFIDLVNSELSKAILSSTLGVEITDQGSRAAAATHLESEVMVTEAHRKMIASTMNHLFFLVTRFNFGEKVRPPYFEFYEESEAKKTAAESFDIIRKYLPLPLQFVSDRLQVELATKGEAILPGYAGEWDSLEEATQEVTEVSQVGGESDSNEPTVQDVVEADLPQEERQIEDGLALPDDLEHRDTVAFSAYHGEGCQCGECGHEYSAGTRDWVSTLSPNDPLDIIKLRSAKSYSRFLAKDLERLVDIVEKADSVADLQTQLIRFYQLPRKEAQTTLTESMVLAWLLGYEKEKQRADVSV